MTQIEQMIKDMCPHGVEWKTIGETLGVNRGKRLTKSELSEDGSYEVYHGSKDTPLGCYTASNAPKDTVIVVNTGGIGGVKYLDKDFWCSDGSFWIGHSDIVNNKFLYYFLSRYEGYFESQKRVGGVPTIDRNAVENFPIPLPPLEIQKKIVECLDKFSALAAELQAELQMRRKQYEYYRTHLLTPHSDCNSAGDSTDDCNWVTKPLSEIAELKAGTHISAEHIFAEQDDEHPYPCFGGNGIRGYVANYSHEEEYPIIGRQGALCGCINYAQGKFYATEHAVVVKAKANNNPRYLFHMLTFADLNQYKSQGAQPGLAVGNLNVLNFSIPSIREQKRIADLLDKFEALTTSLSDGIPAEQAAQQKRYEYYRDKLLTFPMAEK